MDLPGLTSPPDRGLLPVAPSFRHASPDRRGRHAGHGSGRPGDTVAAGRATRPARGPDPGAASSYPGACQPRSRGCAGPFPGALPLSAQPRQGRSGTTRTPPRTGQSRVAQSAERPAVNRQVIGSSPIAGATLSAPLTCINAGREVVPWRIQRLCGPRSTQNQHNRPAAGQSGLVAGGGRRPARRRPRPA
jgi:hypothetical protein